MALHPQLLPHLSGGMFLADGGLETTLVFLRGIELPSFAAYPLLANAQGREELKRYFLPYLSIAEKRTVGFVLDTATWRANSDWGAKLGHDAETLTDFNRQAVGLASELRDEFPQSTTRIVINGVVGPRGDGYKADRRMTVEEAKHYHRAQIETFKNSGADMVSGVTINYAEEAIGIVNAAVASGIPVAISLTVETDGRLPTGQSLEEAIGQIDRATGNAPAYFMINCAHTSHFDAVIAAGGSWLDRIRGVRANASRKSHTELDESTELDRGDPAELAESYRALKQHLNLNVVGGCCGTDSEHVAMICEACFSAAPPTF